MALRWSSLVARLPTLLIAAGLILALGRPARGDILPFVGTLGIEINGLEEVIFPGSGSATLNGTSGGAHLESLEIPAGVFDGSAFFLVEDSVVAAVHLTPANGPGTFTDFGVAPNPDDCTVQSCPSVGVMPIRGQGTMCLFSSDCTEIGPGLAITVPFTADGTRGAGIGGSPHTAMNDGINVTVEGAPWTIHTAIAYSSPLGVKLFTGLSARGFAHGPVSGTSSTAAASGVVSLVTPVQISSDLGEFGSLPVMVTATLHFVPEPGALLLLGTGIAGFMAMGRKRMQSSAR